jgi:hypothetical protein
MLSYTYTHALDVDGESGCSLPDSWALQGMGIRYGMVRAKRGLRCPKDSLDEAEAGRRRALFTLSKNALERS